MTRITVDERPRCQSVGDYPPSSGVPCDLEAGHKGRHEWDLPMSYERFCWTTKNRNVIRCEH